MSGKYIELSLSDRSVKGEIQGILVEVEMLTYRGLTIKFGKGVEPIRDIRYLINQDLSSLLSWSSEDARKERSRKKITDQISATLMVLILLIGFVLLALMILGIWK